MDLCSHELTWLSYNAFGDLSQISNMYCVSRYMESLRGETSGMVNWGERHRGWNVSIGVVFHIFFFLEYINSSIYTFYVSGHRPPRGQHIGAWKKAKFNKYVYLYFDTKWWTVPLKTVTIQLLSISWGTDKTKVTAAWSQYPIRETEAVLLTINRSWASNQILDDR